MSYAWQKEHVRQPLRDEPVDESSAAWGEPDSWGSKKSPFQANETVSSYSSRFSAHLRLYGFVIGIVSGANVAHGFPLGRKRPFDDPIPLPRARQLITLEDAGAYITKLPLVLDLTRKPAPRRA
jgi:hypothetical protein